MIWYLLVCGGLSTYYFSLSIANLDGPFGLFQVIRNSRMFRVDRDDWVSRGIRCVTCVSLYVSCAYVFMLLTFGHTTIDLFLPLWFGSAGLSVFIDKVWKR